MLEKLKAMLKQKEDEKLKLASRAKESNSLEEVRGINMQIEALNDDIAELRGLINEAENNMPQEDEQENRTQQVNNASDENLQRRSAEYIPGIGTKTIETVDLNKRNNIQEDTEKRYAQMGNDLKESRAVSVNSSSIILPNHQSNEIGQTFNEVSSLIDGVTIKPLVGGESYKKAYVKGYGIADYTSEGGNPTTTEPQFGYADITKSKVTAYAEETEEVEKLPAVNYANEIEKGIKIATRKKLAKEILVGDGSTGHLTGIFSSNASAIDSLTDVEINQITNTTLDDVIFGYGGDEEVEDEAVLILNKVDLKAFSQIRTNDGKKFHTIVSKKNGGTIDGVPYIINSACKAIADDNTTTGEYAMAYGPLSNYELAIFSDTEIKKSTEYKFKEGMIAHRANTFAGGNVVAYNGFLRIKKTCTLGSLNVTSVAGTAVGATAITVSPAKALGNKYKYKTAASVSSPQHNSICVNGYTDWDGVSDITATADQKILVVEVDANNRAKKAGVATVTLKA